MTKGITISEKFKPLFDNEQKVKYYIITGGRGSSKSFTCNLNLVARSCEQHAKILFTRYTLSSARISIIPEFEDKIDLLGLSSVFDVKQNEIINTNSGGQIIFKGIKTSSGVQTAALKSIQGVTDWVLDEAEELIDEATFDKINLSIRSNKLNNRVILIMNPTTKEHFIYKRFFEAKGVEPGTNAVIGDTAYIHTTYLDNIKNLPDDFIAEAQRMKETNFTKYQNVMQGGWLDKAEGVIYSDWKFGKFDRNLPCVYGLDFGYSVDPDALIQVAIDRKRKIIYAKEHMYKRGNSPEDLNIILKDRVTGNSLIIADSAESRLIDHLKSKGNRILGAEKGAGSIKEGIMLIQDYQLIIDGDNLAKELNNYVWNDKKSGVPVDKYNHLLDALRYAVSYLLKPRRKSSNKVFLIN